MCSVSNSKDNYNPFFCSEQLWDLYIVNSDPWLIFFMVITTLVNCRDHIIEITNDRCRTQRKRVFADTNTVGPGRGSCVPYFRVRQTKIFFNCLRSDLSIILPVGKHVYSCSFYFSRSTKPKKFTLEPTKSGAKYTELRLVPVPIFFTSSG
jgi:hypothetical protein